LRLVRDFTDVPLLLVRAVDLALLASVLAIVIFSLALMIGLKAWRLVRQPNAEFAR